MNKLLIAITIIFSIFGLEFYAIHNANPFLFSILSGLVAWLALAVLLIWAGLVILNSDEIKRVEVWLDSKLFDGVVEPQIPLLEEKQPVSIVESFTFNRSNSLLK